jgi:hypothetical protein
MDERLAEGLSFQGFGKVQMALKIALQEIIPKML